jgi:hypothetical protein
MEKAKKYLQDCPGAVLADVTPKFASIAAKKSFMASVRG